MENTFTRGSITAEAAFKMIEAAATKAKSIGVALTIAVLDESGNLKAFCRMDRAPLISIDIAQNKAYTALLGAPSQAFFERIKNNPGLVAGLAHVPRIAPFMGGLPIQIGGQVVGAIGGSGGTGEQDAECVQAGLDAIK
jgi:uncharacterized protein GlcG (DUF336 family)